MGTVGINFGAATAGTGFDVTSAVSSILAISSAIETPWKSQLTTLAAQDTALTSLGTDLSTLSTSLTSLTDFEGIFSSKQGSSSNSDALTLTSASNLATAGSHTVTVTSLASTSSDFSDQVTDAATDLLTGTLKIQVGPANAQTVTLATGGETLAQLSAQINGGSYGVTASVVTSPTGSRLSLVSDISGAAGQLTLTPALEDATTGTAITFPSGIGQTGKDAVLNVDGLDTSSSSNTVTSLIPGVTFQLLAPSTSPIQIQITNDNASIETAAQTFVTAYNAIVAAVTTQEANDPTGAAEPLFGSPTLSQLQSQLSGSLFTGSKSGLIGSITQLGITAQENGTLSLDTSTLDSVLNSNYTDVQGFFQNAGSFGQSLSSTLDNLGSGSTTGLISLALAQDSSTESSLNKNVTNEDALIAAQKISLTTELNTANQILQSIPEQLTEVNEIYSATTGYNSSQNG